jgi:phosphomevalonate kinase
VSQVTTSAPGKIILCGEYAVLDGAPAIVTAVGCRAMATVKKISGTDSVIRAPGRANEEVTFKRDSSGFLHWISGRFRLVEEVFDEFREFPMSAVSLTLDTQAFRDRESGRKFGLGSSAAIATALASALDRQFACKQDVYSVASRSHWAYQAGRGSGADVAASFHGGTICFEKQLQPKLRQLKWPTGLLYRIFWSGHSANTAHKLIRLQANRAVGKDSAEALTVVAAKVVSAWENESVSKLLDELRRYTSTLKKFSESHRLGIFDAGHQSLLEPANALGLVYKPCGAGGGDIGVVFGADEGAIDTFSKVASREGFTSLNIAVGANGVAAE